MQLGGNVDAQFDKLKNKLEQRLESDKPILIQPYRWFGTQDMLTVRGRVLRQRKLRSAVTPVSPERPTHDSFWDNLVNSYKRLNSDEIPYAKVRAEFGGVSAEFTANDEGHFEGQLPIHPTMLADTDWQTVKLTLLEPTADEPYTTEAQVLVPRSAEHGTEFGIISDVDDTILQTHATNLLKAAQLTFLSSARMRLPFAGVAAFYHALQGGLGGNRPNPIFYVSSSPWNIYDLLIDFKELQNIPVGPLGLRDYGLDVGDGVAINHHGHKMGLIETILATYPAMKFVLIGDSGQKDPEIYSEVLRKHPDRILQVFIRDVTTGKRDKEVKAISAEFSNFHFVADSAVAGEISAENNLIQPAQLAVIQREVDSESLA